MNEIKNFDFINQGEMIKCFDEIDQWRINIFKKIEIENDNHCDYCGENVSSFKNERDNELICESCLVEDYFDHKLYCESEDDKNDIIEEILKMIMVDENDNKYQKKDLINKSHDELIYIYNSD